MATLPDPKQVSTFESHEGRTIKVSHSTEGWSASYCLPDEKEISEGWVYNTAEECLEKTRVVISWEIEQDKIFNSFKELLQQFKMNGSTDAAILVGLTDAFGDIFASSSWKTKLIDHLEEVIKAAKLPGRLLP